MDYFGRKDWTVGRVAGAVTALVLGLMRRKELPVDVTKAVGVRLRRATEAVFGRLVGAIRGAMLAAVALAGRNPRPVVEKRLFVV